MLRTLKLFYCCFFIVAGLLTSQAIANTQRVLLPPFSLTDHQGNTLNLEDYRGKVVVVNFWATWCPPCIHEFPSIQALKKTFKDQPFEIFAINMGEDVDSIHAFTERLETPVNFPILVDPTMSIAEKWKVRGLPTTLLIDKQGKLAVFHFGEKDWNDSDTQDRVNQLLGE